MQEYGYRNAEEAHRAQKSWESKGRTVSFVAYDPERDLYVFDVYPRP